MKKSKSIKRGLGFGLASGIITTLGLIIGLYFSTYSKIIVIEGILIIALIDALSDAFGMHLSEEFALKSDKHVFKTMAYTFFFKLIFALSFLIFIIPFSNTLAIILSTIYGLILIAILSYYIAKSEKIDVDKVIMQHLLLGVIVILLSFGIGKMLNVLLR